MSGIDAAVRLTRSGDIVDSFLFGWLNIAAMRLRRSTSLANCFSFFGVGSTFDRSRLIFENLARQRLENIPFRNAIFDRIDFSFDDEERHARFLIPQKIGAGFVREGAPS